MSGLNFNRRGIPSVKKSWVWTILGVTRQIMINLGCKKEFNLNINIGQAYAPKSAEAKTYLRLG